jgi:predicted lipid-binding transport protein (Tim44 family)
MGKWLLLTGVLALSGAFIATEAEARRLGGGRNLGMQRNVTAPPAKPAQQQATPAQKGAQQPAAAQTGNRWMPILGGLALGGMLGYLFGGNGLMGILLIAGLAILAVMAVGAVARRRPGEVRKRPGQKAGRRGSGECAVRTPPGAAAHGTALPVGVDAYGVQRAAKI